MNDYMIFETLKELSDNQRKKESKDNQTTKRKPTSYIYLDENNQIKERKLSELNDSAGSALINRRIYKNPLKLIHDSIFGK
jgi:hypothetical protein